MKLSEVCAGYGQKISDAILAVRDSPNTPEAIKQPLTLLAEQARYSSTAQVNLAESLVGEDPEVPGT